MAKIRMKLEGFEATQKALLRAPEVARSHASNAVALSTFAVAQRARSLVPVGETGILKGAIESSKPTAKGLTGRVGIAAGPAKGYWFFVEFGTRYMAARPFFRPAAELERETFIQNMRRIGPKMERDMTASRFL